MQFGQPIRKLCEVFPDSFRASSENNHKSFFFSKSFCVFKLFLWKYRKQFRQPRQKFLARCPIRLRASSENYQKMMYLPQKKFHENFPLDGHVESRFDKPDEVFSPKVWKRFEKSEKKINRLETPLT